MIYCLPSNVAYIGQSKNIYRRWTQHKTKLAKKEHANPYMQNLYNKYGKEMFVFCVLENREESLNELEAHYLGLLDKEHIMNIGGLYPVISSPLKGKRLPIEHYKSVLEANKKRIGTKLSEETKQKISEGNTGKKHTDTVKQTISIKNKGKQAWNKGVPCSDDQKAHLSKINTGKVSPNKGKKFGPLSEEHREKLSKIHKGRPAHNKGKPVSEETKRKISETLRKRNS